MGVPQDQELKKPKSCLGIRHLQTGMLFLAMVLIYGIRVNISMAIVAMTDSATENAFDWSMQTQSIILSSFFWGYVILQIPGGELAARFGAKLLLIISLSVNSVISLLMPVCAYYGGWKAVCACRVLQGLSQGFVYPSLHNLIGKWIPLHEKSRLGTIIYAGGQLGTALQLMASGFIANAWGWPAIFYVNGALGAIWTAFYVFLGSASPQSSSMISAEERLYIQTSLGQVGEQKKLKTPWRTILTTPAFLSLVFVHSCQAWGFWTLMTEMPSYLKQVLGVDIKANGVMSAMPYLAMYLLSFPFGFLSDYFLKKNYLSITSTRKLNNSIGMFGPAIALVGLSYSPAGDVMMAVIILTVVVGLNAGHLSGFMLVHIDMAPNFAGTLMGITNCVANIVSIMAPLAAGAILKDESDAHEWREVFYISSAIYVAGNVLFLIFGTSETQKWNDPDKDITEGNFEVKPEKAV
ncbi:hypothetical protein K1T71_008063 [Dendrolimus kikuchii]|uniref:Uncharacterized protein n=1 Tax=Dendrolimus kikuchii TaxID=765133 RepID=A0ACC1CYV9_9NEOP|nr:hypothetical protein K1T71_008063 [Dendrolimus kikuchii]